MQRAWHFFGDSLLNAVLLETVLVTSMVAGDTCGMFVSERLGDSLWLRAVIDNTTHGMIAFWSWALVENYNFDKYKFVNCVICAAISMGVDLDHFVAAKSFTIKVCEMYHRFYSSTL